MRLVSSTIALSFLFSFGGGCSKDQQEPAEPTEDTAESNEPAEPEPEPEAAPPPEVPPPPPAPPPAPEPPPPATPAEPSGFTGPKVTAYVTSYALNVRSEPNREAKVVRHIKYGDKVEVIINGEWAKLADHQYISAKRLSETPPPAKAAKPGAKPGAKPSKAGPKGGASKKK